MIIGTHGADPGICKGGKWRKMLTCFVRKGGGSGVLLQNILKILCVKWGEMVDSGTFHTQNIGNALIFTTNSHIHYGPYGVNFLEL